MNPSIEFETVANRIKILKPIEVTPELPSKQWAITVNRITPAPGGLSFNLPNIPVTSFNLINYLSIFEVAETGLNIKYLDLYVARHQHPYRIQINKIVFSAFFPNIGSRMLKSFDLFALNLIKESGIIYLDEHTNEHFKTGFWKVFNNLDELNKHNWGIWTRITDSGKRKCTECKNYFWFNTVISESSNRTICRQCENREKEELTKGLFTGYEEYLTEKAKKINKRKLNEIRSLKEYLDGKSLLDIEMEIIPDYLENSDDSLSEDISLAGREAIIRDFYEYCFSIGLIEKNPLM